VAHQPHFWLVMGPQVRLLRFKLLLLKYCRASYRVGYSREIAVNGKQMDNGRPPLIDDTDGEKCNAAAGLPTYQVHDVDKLKQRLIDMQPMVLSKVSSMCESIKLWAFSLSPWPNAYLGRPTFVGKAISFTNELSFLFFINTPRSAAMQWMAIKCISEVWS